MARVDKIEKEKRLRIVQEWLLQDHTTSDIVTQGVAKWGISKRQVERYVADAYEAFRRMTESSTERRLYYHIQRRMKLLRDMERKQSPSGVSVSLSILDSMAKLEGLAINKHELSGQNGEPLIPQVTINVASGPPLASSEEEVDVD